MMETLYSIRHSEPAAEGLDGKIRQLKAECGEFLGDIDTKVEYVPVPERVEKAEAFIKLVVVAAEELELNVDIERGDGRVVFRFYDAGVYLGKLREFYGYMFKTCDSVAVLPCEKVEGCSLRVDFSYYTHRQFVVGREVRWG